MRYSLFFILSCLVSISAFSKGVIRGSVIDHEGFPMMSAVVAVKGTTIGTVTDIDGAFSLTVESGVHDLEIKSIGYQPVSIEGVKVTDDEVTLLENIKLEPAGNELTEVVVTAEAIRNSESALIAMKRRSSSIMDGISSAQMKLVGDGSAIEASKRVTGVSIEDGKYIYVRGLGDRYTRTTLNGIQIPGLDPDKNSLQMDIFPTNLLDNIIAHKNFAAELPADFTGGLVNIETKAFPEQKIFKVSVSTAYNPQMHMNSDYLTYEGGKTDFLGFDDGTRALPEGTDPVNIPTPISGASSQEVNNFVGSFNPQLGTTRQTSPLDYGASVTLGNQYQLKTEKNKSLGYILSLSYKRDYRYYDDVTYSEYQRYKAAETNELRYANIQTGEVSETSALLGGLAGLAYKTTKSKYRLTAIRLQSGTSRAGKFTIDNDGQAVGQSGYIAKSDNLEYNERSLTNLMLAGDHAFNNDKWQLDWKLSPTWSTSNDPDIRKTAFTYSPVDTSFVAGAGGNPSRIWRYLNEVNASAKIDLTRNYKLFSRDAIFKVGGSHLYKKRDYEILFFDIQFFGNQSWDDPDPTTVLDPANIYPNKPNSLYYQTGNLALNPNSYSANVNNTAFYVANEMQPAEKLKTVIGVRAENYVQRYTGADQAYASGDTVSGVYLDNEEVLSALDFFPSANIIYSLKEKQNLRFTYGRTIARPSFKELSFAQILDPITNRIFNGSLFKYPGWDGKLTATRINNFDLRWELFMERSELISVSAFYKTFDNAIELVRIPAAQTTTEFQARNVGDGQVYGLEFELRKELGFISPYLSKLLFSGNVTLVRSQIQMTDLEFNSRKEYEKVGQNITDTRDMAGQSPYVINAGLSYNDADAGFNAGIFYNVKGPTLYIVGVGLYPDVYTEPYHGVNLSFNKTLGKKGNTSIDLKVDNLLNDRQEKFYQSYNAQRQIFDSMNPGTTFSLGISHNF